MRLRADASVCSTEAVTTVYNLRVADHHTYFVGGSDWGWDVWVHNSYNARRDVPYRDPAQPPYNNGAIHMDHEHAKVWGNRGPATRPLAAETNMRRGGHDAKLYRDYKELTLAFEQFGLSRAEARRNARAAVQSEIDALRVSPPPRPMDPKILDRLPFNPLDQ